MKVAIRDDDVSFLTRPDELEKAYGRIWNRACISFAVIPFVKDSEADACHPFGENVVLLNYLKDKLKKGQIDIMLHGFSHKDCDAGHEFAAGDNLKHKIEIGKQYLEQLFNRPIHIFVPPHNALSGKGVKAVEAMSMDILGSIPLNPSKRGYCLSNMKYIVKKRLNSFRNRKLGKLSYVYPFMMQFPHHRELGCYPLVPSIAIDDLKDALSMVSKCYDRFCLNTHYWELNLHETLKDTLHEFVDVVSSNKDNQFCLATALFD